MPLTGSATLHKSSSDSSMRADSVQYSNTAEKHSFDLHWQTLTIKMLKNALTCVQMKKKKAHTACLSNTITKQLNNSDTCGAVQCGSLSKACYQSNTEDTCSILSGCQTASDHCSASVSLSEALVCRNCSAYRSPQANRQVENDWLTKTPSGQDGTHSVIIYTGQWGHG